MNVFIFFQVSEIFVHEEYNANNIEHDIAILVLNSIVKITAEVRPVCLWNQGDTSLESIIDKEGVVSSNFQVTFIILEYIKF
jgi:secreted trypsin-like serine protease